MEWFKPFWDEYGYSLIMLLGHGILIAVLIEIGAKKLFSSMIDKAEGVKKEKLTRVKAIVSTICGAVFSAAAVYAVVKSMPLPGGVYFYGFWFALVFLVQYLTSMYLLKLVIKRYEEAKNKTAKEPKAAKPKKRNIQVEAGTPVFKRLDDGTFAEI